jgi:molecular chaperone DnaJ
VRTSKDLYGLLELSRGASREDVRKAYRRLVREYHPDTNPGDDFAEERFKEFQHA